ncbi:hypothetical protein VP01_1675g1 [Puccinia sorghi]|uniref:Uncharacterized protein n=1 Tax=Puccinia sorghi TaxID=27349 RepID=A0A0L6VHW8_9BASI|nr:hypothetical protein VP01_1675g1 [Puccinia sorghi]
MKWRDVSIRIRITKTGERNSNDSSRIRSTSSPCRGSMMQTSEEKNQPNLGLPRLTQNTLVPQQALVTHLAQLAVRNARSSGSLPLPFFQKKKSHFTYNCPVKQAPYKARPSRTQQLLNPKALRDTPSVQVPEEFLTKKGIAEKILATNELQRQEAALEPSSSKISKKEKSPLPINVPGLPLLLREKLLVPELRVALGADSPLGSATVVGPDHLPEINWLALELPPLLPGEGIPPIVTVVGPDLLPGEDFHRRIVAAVVRAHLLPEETGPDLEHCSHPSIYAILVGPGLLQGEGIPRIVTVVDPDLLPGEDFPRRIVATVVPAHLLPEETEPNPEPYPHPSINAILVGPGLLPGEGIPRIVTVVGPDLLPGEDFPRRILAAVVRAHLLPEETERDPESCPHPSIYAILVGPGLLPGEDSPRRIVTAVDPSHFPDETLLDLELQPVPSIDAISAAPGLLQGEDFL